MLLGSCRALHERAWHGQGHSKKGNETCRRSGTVWNLEPIVFAQKGEVGGKGRIKELQVLGFSSRKDGETMN